MEKGGAPSGDDGSWAVISHNYGGSPLRGMNPKGPDVRPFRCPRFASDPPLWPTGGYNPLYGT